MVPRPIAYMGGPCVCVRRGTRTFIITSEVMRSLAEPVFCRSTVVRGRGRLHAPPAQVTPHKSAASPAHHHPGRTRTSARSACTARWSQCPVQPRCTFHIGWWPAAHQRAGRVASGRSQSRRPGIGALPVSLPEQRPCWSVSIRTLVAVSWMRQNGSGTKFCTRK